MEIGDNVSSYDPASTAHHIDWRYRVRCIARSCVVHTIGINHDIVWESGAVTIAFNHRIEVANDIFFDNRAMCGARNMKGVFAVVMARAHTFNR